MAFLTAFGRTYLDVAFPARAGTEVRIVERPGRWMTEAQLTAIAADIRAVVRSSVPAGALEYGVMSGERDQFDAAILTVVYHDRRPVAFNALSIIPCELRGAPVEVLHLGLGMVDPSYRGRRLTRVLYGLTCFVVFARRRMRPLWLSNVTQVPAVFGMVGEGFSRVFPTPDPTARRSFDHLCLARQIMAQHRHVFGTGPDAAFDETRFVITNSYTGGSDNLKKTFAEAPKHRVGAFNAMCERELDYTRGDDFLQIGQFTAGAARRIFTRFRPVVAPTTVGMHFALLFLEALVAPVIQWFDPSRPMKGLRPWMDATI